MFWIISLALEILHQVRMLKKSSKMHGFFTDFNSQLTYKVIKCHQMSSNILQGILDTEPLMDAFDDYNEVAK